MGRFFQLLDNTSVNLDQVQLVRRVYVTDKRTYALEVYLQGREAPIYLEADNPEDRTKEEMTVRIRALEDNPRSR